MAETNGLLNRRTGKSGTEGSNPSVSATIAFGNCPKSMQHGAMGLTWRQLPPRGLSMFALRLLLRTHYRLAMLLVVAALLVKAVVPVGYMVGQSSKTFTVKICADGSGEMQSRAITVPIKPGSHDSQDAARSGKACAYSATSMAALGGADVLLLAIALLFILALGFAPIKPIQLQQTYHLRPPLRGPPALA